MTAKEEELTIWKNEIIIPNDSPTLAYMRMSSLCICLFPYVCTNNTFFHATYAILPKRRTIRTIYIPVEKTASYRGIALSMVYAILRQKIYELW